MIESHDKFMERAVALSKKGFPAPNPHVGCVIVKNGQIIGEGYHAYAGADHAEVAALKVAAEKAQGGTAYVTLEPCNHVGRTPACSEALIAAKIAKVFVAVEDPNPKAQGGILRLRNAGIEVTTGVLTAKATKENWIFLNAMRMARPTVAIKAATTADGFMARLDGSSKWITGPKARREGQRLRAEMGAVLVGWRTVQADNPQLTARIRGVKNQPLRVILDPHAQLIGTEKVFTEPGRFLWVVRADHVSSEKQFGISDTASILESVLAELWRQGETGVLVEGGPETIYGFFKESLVVAVYQFVAPTYFGEGLCFRGAAMPENELKFETAKSFDSDICLVLKSQKLDI